MIVKISTITNTDTIIKKIITMEQQYKHQLGEEAQDLVTGYKGIITCRIQYLTGCNRYGLQKKSEKNAKPEEAYYFDENQIKVIGKGVKIVQTVKQRDLGGPQPNPRKSGN